MQDIEENAIDKELFGMLVRRNRLNLGYRRAEDFVNIMEMITGYSISKDALYRIETGKATPTIDFLVAFNIMLGKPAFDTSIIEMCLPKSWSDLSGQEMPRTHTRYEYELMKDIPF